MHHPRTLPFLLALVWGLITGYVESLSGLWPLAGCCHSWDASLIVPFWAGFVWVNPAGTCRLCGVGLKQRVLNSATAAASSD